jgi:ankyrin repeat domain-containing protein 50
MQLAGYNSASRNIIRDFYDSQSAKIPVPQTVDLVPILEKLVQIPERVYIVIDALDECQQKDEMLDLFEAILGWKENLLHLFVASRPNREISDVFGTENCEKILVQEHRVDQDIRNYVRKRLTSDRTFKKRPKEFREEIEAAVVSKADGM